jgi:hypothetical protein
MPALDFNANDYPHDDSRGFDPLPAGWYNVQIEGSELKPTNAGDGQYIELAMAVIDGTYAGRKVWDRLTIVHPVELTVNIAKKALGDICRSVNTINVKQTEELHGKPFRVKLSIKPDERFGPKNECQAYEACTGLERPPTTGVLTPPPSGSGPPVAAPATAASPPAAAANRPPWQR